MKRSVRGICHRRFGTNRVVVKALHTSSVDFNRKIKPSRLLHHKTWDAVRRDKQVTPSNLALKFFDFHYAPLFGERYASIRLGLLSDRKYMAVLNTLVPRSEYMAEQLEAAGGFEVIEQLLKQPVDQLARQGSVYNLDVENFLNKMAENELKNDDQDYDRPLDITERELQARRDAAGLTEFMPATKLKLASDADKDVLQKHRELYKSELAKKTGVIAQIWSDNFELHSVPDESPVYPEHLKVFAKRTADITRFAHFPVLKSGHQGWYLVNGASLLPVLALNLATGDRVLDMCAAPGGKSLITLLTQLPDKLDCNDMKMRRLNELRNMLLMYLPEQGAHREKVTLKRNDATNAESWILPEEDKYDKILVDVPCNTDRDSLITNNAHNPFAKSNAPQRQELPETQSAMLYNALRSVKRSGCVVYSTCTMSPTQNEAVVHTATLDAYRKHGIRTVCRQMWGLETHLKNVINMKFHRGCRWGSLVLPYLPDNYGPMYVCKLQRIE